MADSDEFARGVIRGHCPMGCGETLFIGSSGYVTCSVIGCSAPTAVSDILDDSESEHLVTLSDEGPSFTIRHPLRERLGSALEDCALHAYLAGLDGPPRRAGRYRVTVPVIGHGWHFAPVSVGDEERKPDRLVLLAKGALHILDNEREATGVDEWDESDPRCFLYNAATAILERDANAAYVDAESAERLIDDCLEQVQP